MPRQRRARAAVLWGLAVFAAGQLSLAIAIERCLPELRDADYAPKATRLAQRIAAVESGPRSSVVVLGSSRTVYGLHGLCAEHVLRRELGRPVFVMNFGFYGGGPASELLALDHLVKDGLRPDVAVLEVLPLFLSREPSVRLEHHRLHPDMLALRDIGLLQGCGLDVNHWRREWWAAWPVPCHEHRFAILNRIAPWWLPKYQRSDWRTHPDATFWTPPTNMDPSPAERLVAQERARLEYAVCLQGFQLGGPSTEALRLAVELCRREGIRPVLLLMPEGPTFRSWYPPWLMPQVEAYLATLAASSDGIVINARAWIAEEDFADSHHLLPTGAATFSERLAREALLPLLRCVPAAGTDASGGPRCRPQRQDAVPAPRSSGDWAGASPGS